MKQKQTLAGHLFSEVDGLITSRLHVQISIRGTSHRSSMLSPDPVTVKHVAHSEVKEFSGSHCDPVSHSPSSAAAKLK